MKRVFEVCENLIKMLEHYGPPHPGHTCSPLTNCDMSCSEFHDFSMTMQEARNILKQAKDLSESKPEPKNCGNCARQYGVNAEIERVHAGYAPLISAIEMAFKEADFLPEGRLTRKALAVFKPIRNILAEQNKHLQKT